MTTGDTDHRAKTQSSGALRRVLHVVTADQRRGAELSAASISDGLAALGWSSRVVALAPGGSGRPTLGVPVLGSSTLSRDTLTSLRTEMRDADVVVAHGSRTLPASAIAGLGLSVPVVYANIGDPRYWANSLVRSVRTALLLRRTSVVAAISPSAPALFRAKYRFPVQRVKVVGTGRPAPQTGQYGERRARARAALGLAPDVPVAVTVGALAPEKRVDVAIDAAALVPRLHLLVVGDGPEREALEQRARHLQDRVHFLGRLDEPTDALAAADLIVLSSDSEGVPGVLIEAGLLGLPAVSTDVGFVSDVVVDGRTGRLVPAGRPDALATAVEEVLLRAEEMGAAARRHCAQHFGMEALTRRWSDLLESVASVTHP